MENKHRIIDDQYPMEDTFTKLRERDLKESDELIESSKCSFTNSQQIKKDEDLIGKSSGDTNYEGGSNNNLKDLNRDNQSADNTQIADKAKVVILDDNILSLSCYAEEYPENWKDITESKKEKKDEK